MSFLKNVYCEVWTDGRVSIIRDQRRRVVAHRIRCW